MQPSPTVLRAARLAALACGVALGITAVGLMIIGAIQIPQAVALDFDIYHDRALDFVEGRGFYLERQLAGPYEIEIGDSLYPPTLLPLFLVFLVLPPILWWAIPISIVAAVIVYHRPAWWSWPILGILAVTEGTLLTVVKGNPSLWIAAALAVGTIWRPAAALVLLKPSVAPLALIGIRDRGWWIAAAIIALISLVLLPLWIDYFRVVQNSDVGIGYSLRELPYLLIPLVAWVARTRRDDLPATRASEPDASAGQVAPPPGAVPDPP